MAENWLEELRAGGEVIVSGFRTDASLRTVDKVTPTSIKVGTSYYRKTDGRLKGDSGWYDWRLEKATPEKVTELRRRDLCRFIANKSDQLQRSTVSIEALESIVQAMKQAE